MDSADWRRNEEKLENICENGGEVERGGGLTGLDNSKAVYFSQRNSHSRKYDNVRFQNPDQIFLMQHFTSGEFPAAIQGGPGRLHLDPACLLLLLLALLLHVVEGHLVSVRALLCVACLPLTLIQTSILHLLPPLNLVLIPLPHSLTTTGREPTMWYHCES